MKHAMLIMAHKNQSHLFRLINTFQGRYDLFVHIDKKSDISKDQLFHLSQLTGVKAVYREYRINWSGFNNVRCELFLLKEVLRQSDADYLHLLSGQDYPIKPLDRFEAYFEENKGKEFVEYKPYPCQDWDRNTYLRVQFYWFTQFFDIRTEKGTARNNKLLIFQIRNRLKRRIPDYFNCLYGGSQWFSITRDCAAYLVDYTRKHPSFYRRLKFTYAPGKLYFSTVLMNSAFREKLTNDNGRYFVRNPVNGSSPANLHSDHFLYLATSKAFFARKFEEPVSTLLLKWIDRFLLVDDKVSISENGSWQHNSLAGHCFDPGLAQSLVQLCRRAGIQTAMELGCGPGWYVATLRRNHISIIGYDGNPHVEEISGAMTADNYPCRTADLTCELSCKEPCDLVLCLEVGEHIPTAYEDQLFKNIIQNARKYVIFSWALPDQNGDGHVNPHPNEYVIQRMRTYGFTECEIVKNTLREEATLEWFKKTIMVFKKETWTGNIRSEKEPVLQFIPSAEEL